MGIAFNGKVYSNGVTPIGSGTPVDIGFVDISSATLPIRRVNVTSVAELLNPGIYKTNLGNLQKFSSFNGFLEHAFNTSAYDVPVVIFVPNNNLMQITSPAVKALAYLAYTQYNCNNSNINLYNAYDKMSSMPIPEFSLDELKDFKFSKKFYPNSSQCDNISMFNLSMIQDIVGAQYKDTTIEFYTLNNPKPYITMYVGGYGFKVYYPPNFIYMKTRSNPDGFISVRGYEEPTLTVEKSSINSDFQRGYSFPAYADPNGTSSTKYTLAWNTFNPDIPYDDNIPHAYTSETAVGVSFGLPYNPYIPIAIGEAPFFEKIILDSFQTLNHIGFTYDYKGYFANSVPPYRIDCVEYSNYVLPTGEYKFPSTYSIMSAPNSSGLTGLKVYSPDDGTTIVQEASIDPKLVDPVNPKPDYQFKRVGASNGNFTPWVGMIS